MNLETNYKIQKKGITLVIPNPCGNIKETKMKNSGVEWIGEIPKDWEISKTKYLTKLYTGNSIKDEEKNLYEDKADAVPYISSKDINATFSTTNYENGMYVKHSDNSFVRAPAGSTLMCIEGGSAGKKKTFLNQEVCFVNKLCCFSPIKIDSKFLFYCLNSPNYEEEFRFNISGMIGGVSVGKLNQFILPLPPKETQQRIASYLDKKCSKIEETIQNQQQVIEKLKAYKQSLITEAVTDMKTEIPLGISNPCGNIEFKYCNLGFIADFKNGLNYNTSDFGTEVRFLGVGDFQNYLVLNGESMFSNIITDTEIEDDYYLKNGDIIFVRSNGSKELVGRAIMVDNIDFKVTYSGFCIRLRNKEPQKINSKFLLYFFRSDYFRNELQRLSQGSNIANINQDLLSHIKIPLVDIRFQESVVDFLNKKCTAIDTAIEQKQKLIEKLTEYKKSLIYECVTGKKEI